MSSKDPLPPCMRSLSRTAMRSRQLTAPTLTHFWSSPLAPLFVGLPCSWCWCSCKGVNSSLIKLLPDSHLGLVVLQLGGGAPTFAPRSFLDRYSELPVGSIASLLIATVLPSHGALVIQVKGGGHHVPTLVCQGSLSSHPDLVGIDIALSACPLLHYGGHCLVPYNLVPPYFCSPPASCADYNYGGFFRAAPPPAKDFNYYHPHNGHPLHHGGHPSAQTSSSVYGGHPATLWDVPSFVYGGGTTFPQGHGGYSRVAALVTLSLSFAGSLIHPSLPLSDHRSSSGSDIPTSYSSPGQGLPPPVLHHPLASGVIPPSAPSGMLLPLPLQQRSSSSIPSRTLRLTWMHWGSLSFIFGIPISLPVSPMVPLSRPLTTARPAVFGKVSSALGERWQIVFPF
jgi:hypothetical protein